MVSFSCEVRRSPSESANLSWAKSGLLTLGQRAKLTGLQRGAAEEETRRSHEPVLERGLYVFGLYADFRRNGLSITYGTWTGSSTILTFWMEIVGGCRGPRREPDGLTACCLRRDSGGGGGGGFSGGV